MRDSEKLEMLYQIYEKPFYHIAYAILHQHQQAEDAVSDAFEKIIRHFHKIGEPDSPETKKYMIAIIRNTAINQYRKNMRNSNNCVDLDESITQVADNHDELNTRIKKYSLRQLLADMFSVLSEQDKQIVLLHCQEGLTFGKISELLNMKENTVRKRYERARKRMTAQKGVKDYVP
ncbi:MAG: sigma-70 family RNA polymerase sigma factor [Oscillospiraceae bacterium]|nr:sigma-70 family RNA polymerase sigma factor [Oscillospiraceae bacterium]MDE6776783.1 sigma-70 family RNA polymerase sigma factor [Oscillospiraceae bacterium]